jgi:hypothetical protein
LNLAIVPHEGVGPVRLGMTRSEVMVALKAVPGALNRHESRGTLDYFFESALQVEYGVDGRAHFIGASFHPGCGCSYSLLGLDPWSLSAEELFELLAREDGGQHDFDASEHLFPNIIVTLWDADSQYDHAGGRRRVVFAQVGVGNEEYLRAVEKVRE